MSNFVKLYGSILYSTVWLEPLPTKVVWITMLALADADGIVRASIPGLAQIAGVDRADCEKALQTLASPDPDSKSKEEEGRRVMQVDGGWKIVNHRKYRDLRTETQLQTAERVKAHRERLRNANVTVTDVTNVTRRNGVKRDVTRVTPDHTQIRSEKETTRSKAKAKAPPDTQAFPKVQCDRLFEVWVNERGAVRYTAFRAAISPLFPTAGPKFTDEQLTQAIKTHAEYASTLTPREAGFEDVYKFAGNVERWVRLGAMPSQLEDGTLTERGRLMLEGAA